jgi:hypothetical protein
MSKISPALRKEKHWSTVNIQMPKNHLDVSEKDQCNLAEVSLTDLMSMKMKTRLPERHSEALRN